MIKIPETTVILERLLLGIMVVAATLLLCRSYWSWLASGRDARLLVLVIGLLLVHGRTRHGAL